MCNVYALFGERFNHIKVAYHYTYQIIGKKRVLVAYVKLKENLADIFTKVLGATQHEYLVEKIGRLQKE